MPRVDPPGAKGVYDSFEGARLPPSQAFFSGVSTRGPRGEDARSHQAGRCRRGQRQRDHCKVLPVTISYLPN